MRNMKHSEGKTALEEGGDVGGCVAAALRVDVDTRLDRPQHAAHVPANLRGLSRRDAHDAADVAAESMRRLARQRE